MCQIFFAKTNQEMKNKFSNLKSNYLSFTVYLVVLALSISSCAKKSMFLVSPVQPAARGYAEVNKDKNSNYRVSVELTSLSESNRLSPPKNVYVVWMVSDGDVTKNIGQIKPTSNLKASFETVSSIKPKRIFITAEDDASLQMPGTLVVLTTDKL
jgi:hypothetical protein